MSAYYPTILAFLLLFPVAGSYFIEFLKGDLICFTLSAVFVFGLTLPVHFFKRHWANILFLAGLAVLGFMAAHLFYETIIMPFVMWLQAPLNPPLRIDIGQL